VTDFFPAPARPTPADLQRARRRLLPDVIAPRLDVLFCGINPGLYSTAAGHHFARPGNRFWKVLHASGFTDRLFSPFEDARLPDLDLALGITNLCPRTTATADELTAREIARGGRALKAKVMEYRPVLVAVLGILIGKATGRFYGDLLQERIFRPLGMTTARIISEADIVPGRAAGYRLVGGQLKNQEWVSPSLNTTADGSLYLSALDMARWAEALETNVPLPAALRERMWTAATLADGRTAPAGEGGAYGFGWFLTRRGGQPAMEHSGSWQGFKSYIGRFPAHKLTVYAFANLAEADPGIVVRAVAALYAPVLASPPPSPTPAP